MDDRRRLGLEGSAAVRIGGRINAPGIPPATIPAPPIPIARDIRDPFAVAGANPDRSACGAWGRPRPMTPPPAAMGGSPDDCCSAGQDHRICLALHSRRTNNGACGLFDGILSQSLNTPASEHACAPEGAGRYPCSDGARTLGPQSPNGFGGSSRRDAGFIRSNSSASGRCSCAIDVCTGTGGARCAADASGWASACGADNGWPGPSRSSPTTLISPATYWVLLRPAEFRGSPMPMQSAAPFVPPPQPVIPASAAAVDGVCRRLRSFRRQHLSRACVSSAAGNSRRTFCRRAGASALAGTRLSGATGCSYAANAARSSPRRCIRRRRRRFQAHSSPPCRQLKHRLPAGSSQWPIAGLQATAHAGSLVALLQAR